VYVGDAEAQDFRRHLREPNDAGVKLLQATPVLKVPVACGGTVATQAHAQYRKRLSAGGGAPAAARVVEAQLDG